MGEEGVSAGAGRPRGGPGAAFAASPPAPHPRIAPHEARVTPPAGGFHAVYDAAADDAAAIPWADLAAKPELVEWLRRNPGEGRAAIDVACGLGDNAEAIAAAGYRTTGFDIVEKAIGWARARFPTGGVAYVVADLFDPPDAWLGAFDLAFECFTIQAMKDGPRDAAFPAVARFVRPGGILLLYARTRAEGSEVVGPPWPLMPSEIGRFDGLGLERVEERHFVVERPGRTIPHAMTAFLRRA